jgi:hypothetical protein
MMFQLIATTAAFAISTGLKTMQSRTIALRNYKAVPLISYLIAVLELTVYSTAVGTALTTNTVWPIFILAIGASIGALAGVYVADLISNKGEDK